MIFVRRLSGRGGRRGTLVDRSRWLTLVAATFAVPVVVLAFVFGMSLRPSTQGSIVLGCAVVLALLVYRLDLGLFTFASDRGLEARMLLPFQVFRCAWSDVACVGIATAHVPLPQRVVAVELEDGRIFPLPNTLSPIWATSTQRSQIDRLVAAGAVSTCTDLPTFGLLLRPAARSDPLRRRRI